MKRWVCLFAAFSIILLGFGIAVASESEQVAVQPVEQDVMTRADQLLDAGQIDTIKQSITLYEQILASEPDSYEASWKCAKAYREYGDAVKRQALAGWEKVCTEYGKTGMEYAQKAIALGSDKPEGYFFYGLNVGIYSDGAGILTAIREGLKEKTQSNFEKAYQIDKTIEDGGPIVALGRFWQVVPWPFNDKSEAESLYREFQKTSYYADNLESRIYLSEMLADQWGRKSKEEARQLLEEVVKMSDDPYWTKRAQDLLSNL